MLDKYLNSGKRILFDEALHKSSTTVICGDLGLEVSDIVLVPSGPAAAWETCWLHAQNAMELIFIEVTSTNQQMRVEDSTFFREEL